MTPLPQRKKTAEEIAKLRDQLGVPQGVESDRVETIPDLPAESATEPVSAPTAEPTPELLDFEQALAPDQDFGFTKTISHEEQMAEEQPSKLPVKRRSIEELEEMQRREMLNKLNPQPQTNIKFAAAHPVIIALGYLLATAGFCSFWIEAYPWQAIAGGCGTALLIAGIMALRRPVSRHHAGFISAIAVLVGVFATIHHFPELQHGS